MAEIPVERKGGVPWWVWLLGALLLLALLGLLSRGCDDANTTNTNNINRNANAAATPAANTANRNTNLGASAANGNGNSNSSINVGGVGGAAGANVTDINLFGSTTDKQTLVGRRADLQNVRVKEVLSDRVFTVTAGDGDMYVMLDEKLDSGGGREQQIRARAGQLVNLGGTFRAVPSAETSDERRDKNLDAQEYGRMRDQRVYLHATEARNAG